MPVQSQEQETLNVKLVHFTKQTSPDEPVQFAFSVIDEQGKQALSLTTFCLDRTRVASVNAW